MSHEQLKDVLKDVSNETFTNQKKLVAFIFEMPTNLQKCSYLLVSF